MVAVTPSAVAVRFPREGPPRPRSPTATRRAATRAAPEGDEHHAEPERDEDGDEGDPGDHPGGNDIARRDGRVPRAVLVAARRSAADARITGCAPARSS